MAKNKNTRKKRGGGLPMKVSMCNTNNLNNLNNRTKDEIQDFYKSCCPDITNSDPYCKQIYSKWINAKKKQNASYEYGDDVQQETINMQKQEDIQQNVQNEALNKPWYKVWGGKKHTRSKRKQNRPSKKRQTKRRR
jgi:hypothetical protein